MGSTGTSCWDVGGLSLPMRNWTGTKGTKVTNLKNTFWLKPRHMLKDKPSCGIFSVLFSMK
jgi:hypothetical protein